MSHADPNPYTPPEAQAFEPRPFSDFEQLEYGRSISFVFDNPNWMMNVLGVILCTLVSSVVPVLPAMVIMGYQFEIIEGLLFRPSTPYPDFNFNRIVDYMMRGLYPFLVALVITFLAIPILLILIGIPVLIMVLLLSARGEDGAPIVLVCMIPLIVVGYIVSLFSLAMILVPAVLRAGMSQDFGTAFDLPFIKDFARKMWKEIVLAGIFMVIAALLAEIVGLAMLCVGIFFTFAVIQLSQAHLLYQLYRIYLARGGEKIPLKVPAATAI